ncbi:MAG: mechanosensitive ion channel [Deltaproteobacteria bacterium]|nr:mechanosensitive ion channel [Deltaproteobacteria bacterium]
MKLKILFLSVLLFAVAVYSSFWDFVYAQPPLSSSSSSSTEGAAAEKEKTIVEQLADLNLDRQNIQKTRDSLTAQILSPTIPNDPKLEENTHQELNAINTLDLLTLQQISLLKQKSDLQAGKIRLTEEKQTLNRSFSLPPEQLTFAVLESTRHDLSSEREEMARLRWATSGISSALAEQSKLLDDKEANRRRLREAIERAANITDRQNNEEQYKFAELDSEIAKKTLIVKGIENENNKLGQEVAQLKQDILTYRLNYLSKRVKITEDDLSQQLNQLEDKEKLLRKQIVYNKPKLATCEKNYQDIQKRAANAQASEQVVAEETESHRLCREIVQNDINILSERIYLNQTQKELWQKRYKFYRHELKLAEIRSWYQSLLILEPELEARFRTQNSKLNQLRAALAKVNTKIDNLSDQTLGLARWLKEQQNYLQKSFSSHIDHIDELEGLKRLSEYCREDIAVIAQSTSWSDLTIMINEGLLAFWHYELFNVDDKPITIKKIIIVIVLLCCAVWFARRFSRHLATKILPRLGLKTGETAAVQSLTFYVLVVFFTLFALELVHVPLTIFTLLGGAVAIGIGFGSQNIMNNFISGIILLIERPIRVGDLVEVEGQMGRVQQIGARSTKILTGTNVDLVVPNSVFLEKSVTNWTLSDETVRMEVQVGVAYESDPEIVKRLLVQAAKSCSHVRHNPEPFATLTDFGDNALLFSVYFWLTMSTTNNTAMAKSDVRCAIDQLFRKHTIAIPFPQRETLLKTDVPLQIQIGSKS